MGAKIANDKGLRDPLAPCGVWMRQVLKAVVLVVQQLNRHLVVTSTQPPRHGPNRHRSNPRIYGQSSHNAMWFGHASSAWALYAPLIFAACVMQVW